MSARLAILTATAALVAAAFSGTEDSSSASSASEIIPPTFSSSSSSGDVAPTSSATSAVATTTEDAATTTVADVATTAAATSTAAGTTAAPTRATAPAGKYPATIGFATTQPTTFWDAFQVSMRNIKNRQSSARGMAAAVATTAVDPYMFLGCAARGDASQCDVAFANLNEAKSVAKLSVAELGIPGVTGMSLALAVSGAPGRSAVVAMAAVAVSAVAMLLA